MATNSFVINGLVVLTNNNIKSQGVLTDTVYLTSSNNLASTLAITSSAWTLINQGTATNLRYLFLSNPNASASVLICQNTSSIQYNTILAPSDTALLPYSGSVTLYGKSTYNEVSGSYLQYISCQS